MRPDVRALLDVSDAHALALYPDVGPYLADADALAGPNVRFVVARYDERAVGCGALVLGSDGMAELKRMIVAAHVRRQGVARAVLTALETIARELGVQTILLETGTLNRAAIALYRAVGYRMRGPFAGQPDDTRSVFMQKDLAS